MITDLKFSKEEGIAMKTKHFFLFAVTLLFPLLLSCGSSDDAPNPTVHGIAATGAAIPNAPVVVVDSTGSTNGGQTDGNGVYDLSVAGMTAPYLIRVSYNGGANLLYSFAAAEGTAHVNPLTSLAVCQALNGDPAAMFASGATPAAVAAAMTTLSANMNSAITAIQNNILTHYPTIASVNPLSSSFVVGAGLDKLLDQINVAVNVTGGTVNVGITSGGKTIFSGSVATFIPANMNMGNMPVITFSAEPGGGAGGTTTVPPTGGTGTNFQGSWKYGGVTFFTFSGSTFTYMVGGITGVASYSSDGTSATIGTLQWTFRAASGTTLTWDQNPGTTYVR